jgi:hypothetical protein
MGSVRSRRTRLSWTLTPRSGRSRTTTPSSVSVTSDTRPTTITSESLVSSSFLGPSVFPLKEVRADLWPYLLLALDRRKVLRHHPDKKAGSGDANNDSFFKCIQKGRLIFPS